MVEGAVGSTVQGVVLKFPRSGFWGLGSREQLLSRNVKQFRGRLVFKAHRPLYHSTLGLRVIKKRDAQSFRPTPLNARSSRHAPLRQYPPPTPPGSVRIPANPPGRPSPPCTVALHPYTFNHYLFFSFITLKPRVE